MSSEVCLAADTLGYPEGGGHFWVYLSWALGCRALGCRVMWLEPVKPAMPAAKLRSQVTVLRSRLEHYGLAADLVLYSTSGEAVSPDVAGRHSTLDDAAQADLLLDLRYSTPPEVIARFKRSALVDIDPGLLQIWMTDGQIDVARHDTYFTTGESVGRAGLPDGVLEWHYTPPCVAIDRWLPHETPPDAPFTTVAHWYSNEWVVERDGTQYANDKRSGFLPFLDLPGMTTQALELALCLDGDSVEKAALEKKGWRVREANEIASTPWDYQRYIQVSRGEFSCAKPSAVRLQNAWISDRTLCYLASGKPAVVQHTGPSCFLPDAGGLFRFRDLHEATAHLETIATDYDRQCRLGRALAEEYFDARKVVTRVLERALA